MPRIPALDDGGLRWLGNGRRGRLALRHSRRMVRMVLRRVHILARVLLLPLAVSRGNHGLHGLHGRHVLAVLHLPLAFAQRMAMVHPRLVHPRSHCVHA
jgi:hypothetical protein